MPDTIANEVLGGGFVSRINLNLREDKGWSSGSMLSTDRFQPIFMVSAPVQVDRTAEAITEIKRELDEYIGSLPATPEEFNQSRERRVRSLAGRFETGRSLLNSLLSSAQMGRPWDYPLRYAEALQDVTLEDVHALGIGEVTEIDEFGRGVETVGGEGDVR